MAKAKAHPDQLGFPFDLEPVNLGPGSLAGLRQQISGVIGSMLNSDPRPREVIAAEMSVLASEKVSRAMLDAYASPARPDHSVGMDRAIVLAAVTKRPDLLNAPFERIGAAILIGDEIKTARLGQIDREMEELKAEKKRLSGTAPLIRGGKKRG